MRKTNFKSILLAVLAMLAVSTMAMTLIACGSDDNEPSASIYKQWESVDELPVYFDSSVMASVVFDLSEQGKITQLAKYTNAYAAKNGLSANKYYVVYPSAVCTVTLNADGTSGKLTPIGMLFNDLTASNVVIDGVPYKAVTKKITGEELPKGNPE